jgi:thiol:disulfide interchange protein
MKNTLTLLFSLSFLLASCEAKKQASVEASPTPAPAETTASHFPEGSPKFGTDYQSALAEAKKENKPVVLVFSAAWCGPCQSMKKTVYPSKEVTPLHDKFVWAYLDVDEEANAAPAMKYKVEAIPHIQFLAADGKEISAQIGGASPGEFAGTLQTVLAKAGQ